MKTRYLRLVKKQRGFTLIELLAVILILGIIALIAIPTVTSVVEQSRKGAAQSSAEQFVTSVGELVMMSELSGNIISDGIYTASELQDKGLNIKGTMPDSGFVQIENGEVVNCNLTYGNYNVTYNGEEYNSVKQDEKNIFTIVEDNDNNNELSTRDKVCFESECFYVTSISGDNVRMIAEWNLNVGYNITYNGSDVFNPYDFMDDGTSLVYNDEIGAYYAASTYTKIQTSNSNIKQEETMKGLYIVVPNQYDVKITGVTKFADLDKNNYSEETRYNGYWTNNGILLPKYRELSIFPNIDYPTYVYDENSSLAKYVNAYANNLKVLTGINNLTADLMNSVDFIGIGCNQESGTCPDDIDWLFNTTFWTGIAMYADDILCVGSFNNVEQQDYTFSYHSGVRPVITVSKNFISK